LSVHGKIIQYLVVYQTFDLPQVMMAEMLCRKGCAHLVTHLLMTEIPVIFSGQEMDSIDMGIQSPIQSYALPMLIMYPQLPLHGGNIYVAYSGLL
jgi:hypothetical protein